MFFLLISVVDLPQTLTVTANRRVTERIVNELNLSPESILISSFRITSSASGNFVPRTHTGAALLDPAEGLSCPDPLQYCSPLKLHTKLRLWVADVVSLIYRRDDTFYFNTDTRGTNTCEHNYVGYKVSEVNGRRVVLVCVCTTQGRRTTRVR